MNRFKLDVMRLPENSESILQNLMELYLHDMAEWFKFDLNEDGLYGYELAPHWEKGDVAHLLLADNIPAGFALVAEQDEPRAHSDAHEIEEFFVIRSHRHRGVADYFATQKWDQQPGPGLIRGFEANLPAVPFWRRVIANYTNDLHSE